MPPKDGIKDCLLTKATVPPYGTKKYYLVLVQEWGVLVSVLQFLWYG